jgi:hypothetical protein
MFGRARPRKKPYAKKRLWLPVGGGWGGRRHAQRHGRTAAHFAAPGLCIGKATRNALHGSGSGFSSAAAASAQSMARSASDAPVLLYLLLLAKKLGRRR